MSEIMVAPGQETGNLCQSWTLDNPQELFVTAVAMQNDGGYHHSNWFFVPDDTYNVPDGTWNCEAFGFSEFEAAVRGGFLYAQSTQVTSEVQRFPAGGAVRIPPYSRVIGNTHLRNVSGQPLTTRMNLRLDTTPPGQVRTLLTPGRFQYRDLHIEPRSRSTFTAECDLAGTYQSLMERPFRFTLYYVLPHYHELGTRAEITVAGGPHDGMILHRHLGFGTSFGKAIDPPVDLAALGATGLRFTCSYDNPRDEEVYWGIHGHEMCVFAVFADTDMGFEAEVAEDSGQVVGISKDQGITHTAPCLIQGVPWQHDRPGGPPR